MVPAEARGQCPKADERSVGRGAVSLPFENIGVRVENNCQHDAQPERGHVAVSHFQAFVGRARLTLRYALDRSAFDSTI